MHRKRKYTTLRLLVYHPTVKLLAFIEKKLKRVVISKDSTFLTLLFFGVQPVTALKSQMYSLSMRDDVQQMEMLCHDRELMSHDYLD